VRRSQIIGGSHVFHRRHLSLALRENLWPRRGKWRARRRVAAACLPARGPVREKRVSFVNRCALGWGVASRVLLERLKIAASEREREREHRDLYVLVRRAACSGAVAIFLMAVDRWGRVLVGGAESPIGWRYAGAAVSCESSRGARP